MDAVKSRGFRRGDVVITPRGLRALVTGEDYDGRLMLRYLELGEVTLDPALVRKADALPRSRA